MRGLSLYSGIGLSDLAAHAAGIRTVALCEPDPYCRSILAARYPDVPIYEYDTEVTLERLAADNIGPIDIIHGGPPCQPSSAAGKRLGAGDPRWRWPEFLRIVGDVRPRWLCAENPVGLLSLFGGNAFADILDSLAALGYRVGWCVYGADALGAPHRRDRVFLTGYLADTDRGRELQPCGPLADIGQWAGHDGIHVADAAGIQPWRGI